MSLSQPAVSLTISQLEGAVGLVLLERHASGATLTPEGVVFLARAEEVCTAYIAFKDAIKLQRRRMDREVWVGIDGSWDADQLSEVLKKESFGKDVKFCHGNVGKSWAADLEAGRVDVVIASRFLQNESILGAQEAVMRFERGITIAWHPSFYPFDRSKFNFPAILRTTLLIPNEAAAKGFGEFISYWCDYAYGAQAANTVYFESETEAAMAADAGLGVFLGPGDSMRRLEGTVHELDSVRTFEFLLPEAFRFGVYCRADERAKEVMNLAGAIGRAGKKSFSK